MALPHAGSWFGLPDFGVTEAVGGLLGRPRSAQGGSNIIGNNKASTGQVLPASTGPNFTPVPQYSSASSNPVATSSPTGGSGGSRAVSPSSSQPVQQQADPFMQLIDQEANARLGDLNNQAGVAGQNFSSIQGDINSSYNTSRDSLGRNLATSQAQIDTSAQQGEQRKVDALSAARNLYNELIMGGQQRFGGASSAGEAYQALTGRELQRNNQQIGTDFNSFMSQITMAKQTVQSKFDDAVSQLENQKQQALSQATRDYQNTLAQINSMKSQVAGEKANRQLAALQELRNNIYNINIATAQNSQALNQFKQQQEAELEGAINQFGLQANSAQAGVGNFGAQASTNPQSALSFGGGQPAQQGFNPTGIAGVQDEQDQYGNRMFA